MLIARKIRIAHCSLLAHCVARKILRDSQNICAYYVKPSNKMYISHRNRRGWSAPPPQICWTNVQWRALIVLLIICCSFFFSFSKSLLACPRCHFALCSVPTDMLLCGINFKAASGTWHIEILFLVIFSYLNECCFINDDETVPSIMMKISIKINSIYICLTFSSYFFLKVLLHFCQGCPFTLCGLLIDMLPHGIVFKAV